MDKKLLTVSIALAALPLALLSSTAQAQRMGEWGTATAVANVNSPVADGCPIEGPDGLSLFIASMRDGGFGGNDIWVAKRLGKDQPFGTPVHLPAPVNSAANDFCPTPMRDAILYFVSERTGEGTCNSAPGRGDIYRTRKQWNGTYTAPLHLGCLETGTGPNTNAAEFSPSLVTTVEGTFLYFSSTVSGNHDIYRSQLQPDGSFGAPLPVVELNSEADDRMPNITKDGLEIVFSSTRSVDAYGNASIGSFDVYVSTRTSPTGTWSAPRNLGGNVNTPGSETRSTISWDRLRLYFGRDGEIYSSSRAPLKR